MRLLLFLAAAVLVYLLAQWLARQPARIRWQYGALAVGLLLVGLAVTGRLSWIAAAVGAALPFAQRLWRLVAYLPTLQRIAGHFSGSGAQAGARDTRQDQTSSVETEYLRMVLAHTSGQMDGEILKGPHQGTRLHTLPLKELSELLELYEQRDPESALLLRTYLERRFGEGWEEDAARSHRGTQADGAMPVSEALAILGLEEGASRQEIIDAHRRLMQRLHPDRGGSTYFAIKLNAAKRVLLGD